MSDQPVPEVIAPSNAPSTMRPRRPVLDEPLDLDRPKKVFPGSWAESGKPEPEQASGTLPETQAETAAGWTTPTTPADPESVTVEPPAEAEATVVMPPVEPTEDLQLEQAFEPVPARGMSGLQSVIVILLFVLVGLALAVVFLYIKGRIELPQEILQVVEGWFDFIP